MLVGPALYWFLAFAIIGVGLACAVWIYKRSRMLSGLSFAVSIGLGLLMAMIWPVQPQRLANDETNPRVKQNESNPPATQSAPSEAIIKLASLARFHPSETSSEGYIGSGSCNECHNLQHDSWHHSYHRTMTQLATSDAVIGKFDGQVVEAKGRTYRLWKKDGLCWVEMNDPDFPPTPETRAAVPIVMTTGSHHMQVYWYPTAVGRTLSQLPIVYLNETEQWISRTAAFLKPPDSPISSEFGRWNSGCSECHSTNRRERKLQDGYWDTEVAEFGISCEACHGPAEKHVAFRRETDPSLKVDPILNPSDLNHMQSTQVCGQCHSVHSNHETDRNLNIDGHGFRPGDDYADTHHLWTRDSDALKKFLQRMNFSSGNAEAKRRVYWDDGMVRVSGREYNGLAESACYLQGEMSCLSCHAMHQSSSDVRQPSEWANDQLSAASYSDHACTQCHEATDYAAQHTHHLADSAGSRCYNCHMPHTTYGLMKAIRSHTITIPDVAGDRDAGRPNACNLCHLDQTLEWADQNMIAWYKHEPAQLSQEERSVAASILWALKGDAGLRALTAWHMGWSEAQFASDSDWMGPYLTNLLVDPYDSIRFIARRSIRSLDEFKDEPIDASQAPADLNVTAQRLQQRWPRRSEEYRQSPNRSSRLLLDSDGPDLKRIDGLLRQRDQRPVSLLE